MIIIKVLGAERSIATANSFSNTANLVRVVNPTTAAVLNIAYANGVVYANTTVTNTQPIIVEKGLTDTLQGTGMLASPVAYRG
jgi:hypothetical protein